MERGDYAEVNWIKLSSKNGVCFSIEAKKQPIQIAALAHTDQEILPVEYKIDLPKCRHTVLMVATKTLGV